MLIVTKKSSYDFAKREAGGKGFNLYLMTQNGLPVPNWCVLGKRFFHQFGEAHQLWEKIAHIFENHSGNAKLISESIDQLITSLPLPKTIEEAILGAYQNFQGKLVAVRSSALGEDSARHSFAGQLSTFLYIRNREELLKAIKGCWASAYSERGLVYRSVNNLEQQKIAVAVVIQEMVDSEKSGVVFTCDPIKQDPTKLTINSVYGIGEGIVSGLLDADTFIVDKKTYKIETQELVLKNEMLVQDKQLGGLTKKEVPTSLQQKASLSEQELRQLSELANRVEHFYRFPQDIEWGLRDGKIYLLQSRPVTTEITNQEGRLFIWDNSNIIESYGGVTLPLTFDFARYVYNQVYVQFCEILLIPQKRIKEMDFFLRNMLGIFYGRIYYNLLNWYKLTSILPGFKYNRQFMETMMGTNHSLSDEIADRIKPPAFQEKFSSKVLRFISGAKFFYFHLAAQQVVDRFLKYFYLHYNEFKKINIKSLTAEECYAQYQKLEMVFLTKWKAPIINDYLCMVHFGLLKKLTQAWLSDLGNSLANDLLAGDGHMESAEPTREVMRMAHYVLEREDLLKLLLKTPAEDCLEVLKQNDQHQEFYQRILSYIDRFGFRCMSEMKLEQRDLHQEPATLFVFIKNHLQSKPISLEELEVREKQTRYNAEVKVKKHLTGIKKCVFLWSLKHARRAVRNRENTRFCRTRVYGLVRSLLYRMGEEFTARGILEQDFDIFYLSLNELNGAFDGHNPIIHLQSIVNTRKALYATYNDMETAPRFITRGPVYWQNQFTEKEQAVEEHDLPPNCMKGIPCSPGIIEGVVKVILSPNDNLELNKEILVTERTDPGWVPLYPSAKGLLVERGGLLSHSAIVAREMGLPTIVSIKNLTKRLKTGMRIRFNGETGIIEILEEK